MLTEYAASSRCASWKARENTTTPEVRVSSLTASTGSVPIPTMVTVVATVVSERSEPGSNRRNVRRSPTSRSAPLATVSLTNASSGASGVGQPAVAQHRELERKVVAGRGEQPAGECGVDAVGDAEEAGVDALRG